MKNLIPVEGKPNLYRDKNTGAIINTDTIAYKQHLKHTQNILQEKNRIDKIETDVQEIKNDISDIRVLLTTFMSNYKY